MLSDSSAWDPEPVVVAWARSVCESCSSAEGARHRPRPAHLSLEYLDDALATGADINASGYGGETALHVVARKLGVSTFNSESRQLAQLAWHHLVARGAESSAVDIEGTVPLDKLSGEQCRELLATKRKMYSARRYERARLHGRDASQAWTSEAMSQDLASSSTCSSPFPGDGPSFATSKGASSELRAFRTPRRPTAKTSSTSSQSGTSWVASLRTPRSARMSSPRTPRNKHLSACSGRSLLASPDTRCEKERVYFTPPRRSLPNWES